MSISPDAVISAVIYGPISEFFRLLDAGYKMDVLNEKGQTALHLMFYEKDWELFDLVEPKISSYELYNINFTDCEGLTHLHIACMRGSLSLVSRYLHDNNINACYKGLSNSAYSGFTALHFAVINPTSHKKIIVKSLIERGADVEAVDSKNRTPLHIAARFFEKQSEANSYRNANIEVMNILINKSNIEARDLDGNTPLLSAFSLKYDEFKMDNRDNLDDAAHVSVYMPEVKEKLKFFLQHGSDVTAMNNKIENVLHLILESLKLYRYNFPKVNYIFDDSDHHDMIKQIFDANPNINSKLKNYKGETPLETAVKCISPKIVEVLLDHGADLRDLKIDLDKQRRFFCYPNMVITFEAVQELMNLLDLLSDRGFNISLRDNIVITDFLLHYDNKCDCCSYPYTNIKVALQYGSNEHNLSILERLYENLDSYDSDEDPDYVDAHHDVDLHGTEELYSDLMEYLDTTTLANIYSDEEIMQTVDNINKFILSERFDPNMNYVNYMEEDLNSLKSIIFENTVSLHDVLQKDPENTPRWIVNEFDLKMIENLHCYKDAVKGHFTKARVRIHMEKYFCDYLRIICGPLPDVCCWKIANYFNNEEMLIMAFNTLVILKLICVSYEH